MTILTPDFYRQPDVLLLSRQLLGKFLMTDINGARTGGMISETEAYMAPEDRASHAWGNRRTKRTEVMFQAGGISYVYLCYGIHYLFNVITNLEDIPHAILIRALYPTDGIGTMMARRHKLRLDATLTSGPGALTQALGITLQHNALSLQGPTLWIEDRGLDIVEEEIIAQPRVGIDYAGEHALLPWRFTLKNENFG